MFCPRCRSEYREEFTECSSCNVPLVKELSPLPPEPEFINFEEVLATRNLGEIAMLKSLLDSEGIYYFFKGENFNYSLPPVEPARLMVRKDQVKRAEGLIECLKLSENSDDEE